MVGYHQAMTQLGLAITFLITTVLVIGFFRHRLRRPAIRAPSRQPVVPTEAKWNKRPLWRYLNCALQNGLAQRKNFLRSFPALGTID